MQTHISGIRFGSEVYTWFMKESGRANANRLDHMIDVIAQAVSPHSADLFLDGTERPRPPAQSLASRGLNAAMSFVLINHEGETEGDCAKPSP